MSRPSIPYSMRIAMALLGKDQEKANMITAEAVGCAGQAMIDIANGFEASDLPFVLVAMNTTYHALYASLDQNGKTIVDNLVKRTECITINASAIKEMLEHGREEEQ